MQANEFGMPKAGPGRSEFTASCGAMDRRECTMMKHILLAEIRRSNAPDWVAEEVEKKAKLPFLPRADDEDESGIMAVILPQSRPTFLARGSNAAQKKAGPDLWPYFLGLQASSEVNYGER